MSAVILSSSCCRHFGVVPYVANYLMAVICLRRNAFWLSSTHFSLHSHPWYHSSTRCCLCAFGMPPPPVALTRRIRRCQKRRQLRPGHISAPNFGPHSWTKLYLSCSDSVLGNPAASTSSKLKPRLHPSTTSWRKLCIACGLGSHCRVPF